MLRFRINNVWLTLRKPGASRQAALLLLLGLAGCADTPWPSWISGEPSAEVTGEAANYPGISRLGARPDNWRNVRDVPSPPAPVSGATAQIEALSQQREQNLRQQKTLLNEPVP